MMDTIIIKGNKVQLATYLKWNVHNVLGHKEIVENSTKFVNFIWCKVCASNKNAVLQHSCVKGAAMKAAERFINGTINVTSDNVSFNIMFLVNLSNE